MELAKSGKGHLIFGSVLVIIALVITVVLLVTQLGSIGAVAALGFGVFFFGVWGGVEIGRVVETKFREKQGESK